MGSSSPEAEQGSGVSELCPASTSRGCLYLSGLSCLSSLFLSVSCSGR